LRIYPRACDALPQRLRWQVPFDLDAKSTDESGVLDLWPE
jgi:hypothetical protein